MEKNRQKTESTQCQPEMQSAGASTQPTLNQHPLKEYSKYVTFNVMGMIGVSCYILADTFFVSKALGAQGLAALNLALPIFNAIRGIGMMMGMGGATWYSIRKGQHAEEEANRIFSIVVTATFLCSLLFILAGVFFSSQIASAFGADESLLDLSGTYLKVLCCFAPFFMLNDVMICFIRNDGDPNLGMAAMVVGSLANILLDYIFIFSFGLGLFGAALATGVAPVIGICLTLIHWTKPSHTLKFELRTQRIFCKADSVESAVVSCSGISVLRHGTGYRHSYFGIQSSDAERSRQYRSSSLWCDREYFICSHCDLYRDRSGRSAADEQSFRRGRDGPCAKESALCCLDYCRGFCVHLWSHFFLFRRDHTDIQQ